MKIRINKDMVEFTPEHAAEAAELGNLLDIGERLNRVVASMLPVLWNAAEKEKRRQADGPLPPYSHHHVFKSENGGGSLLDVGVYGLNFAEWYLVGFQSVTRWNSSKGCG